MKKAIVLTLSPFLFGAVALQAQTAPTSTPAATEVVSNTQDKTPLKKEALPEAVQNTLASEAYKGTEFVAAQLVKENNIEFYAVSLKQGEKTIVVKLDKEGKKID